MQPPKDLDNRNLKYRKHTEAERQSTVRMIEGNPIDLKLPLACWLKEATKTGRKSNRALNNMLFGALIRMPNSRRCSAPAPFQRRYDGPSACPGQSFQKRKSPAKSTIQNAATRATSRHILKPAIRTAPGNFLWRDHCHAKTCLTNVHWEIWDRCSTQLSPANPL